MGLLRVGDHQIDLIDVHPAAVRGVIADRQAQVAHGRHGVHEGRDILLILHLLPRSRANRRVPGTEHRRISQVARLGFPANQLGRFDAAVLVMLDDEFHRAGRHTIGQGGAGEPESKEASRIDRPALVVALPASVEFAGLREQSIGFVVPGVVDRQVGCLLRRGV